MNRLLLICICIVCTSRIQAQLWIDVGAKGMFGLTALYNQNVIDDRNVNFKLKTGYGFGGRVGFNFGANHALNVEGIHSVGRQAWEYSTDGTQANTFTTDITWTNWDLYTLYRFNNSRTYVDIGPKFSFVQSVKQTDTGVPGGELDNSSFYATNLTGASLGFGGFIAGGPTFSLVLGLRIDYTFTDFNSSEGKDAGYPLVNKAPYDSYKKTNPLAAQVGLELNFGIGEFARGTCGRRGFFFGSHK